MELYYMFGSFWFWVFILFVFFSHRSLKRRIVALENQLKNSQVTQVQSASQPVMTPVAPAQEHVFTGPSDKWEDVPAPQTAAAPVSALSDDERGGRLLGKVGAGALLVGVSFFLKYAFDNNWIGPSGRVGIGLLAGLLMVLFGQTLRKKYETYADIVIGGGIGVLYLSIYSAFGFYHLIPESFAFVCMIAVTILAIVMSVVGNTIQLAVFGVVGGFATPALLATGQADFWTLMPYVLILDLAIFVIAYYKRWAPLTFIGFAGTYILFGGWASDSYNASWMMPVMLFATVYFAIYLLTSVAHHLVRREVSRPEDYLLITANAAVYTFIAYNVLYGDYHAYSGFFAVAMALIYFCLAYAARVAAPADKGLNWYLPAIAIVFLTIAIPLQFTSELFISFAWLVEAMFLYMLAFNLRLTSVRQCAFIVYCIGILSWLTNITGLYVAGNNETAMIALRIILGIIAVMVTAVIAYQYHLHQDQIEGDNAAHNAATALVVTANILTIIFVTTEINQYFARQMLSDGQIARTTISIFWAIYAISALIVGIKRRSKLLRVGGLGFFFLTVFKVVMDVWSLGDLYRIISFIAVGVIALGGSFVYLKYKDKLEELV